MPGVLMKGRAGEARPPGSPGLGGGWAWVWGLQGVPCAPWWVPGHLPHLTSLCTPLSLLMHYQTPRGLFLSEMLLRSLNIRQGVFSQPLAVPRSAAPVRGRNPLPDSTRDAGTVALQNCGIFSRSRCYF